MTGPNLRWTAVKLACRLLLLAATGPSREPDRQAPRLEPADPLPMPDWWPFDQPTGRSFDIDELRLIRQAALKSTKDHPKPPPDHPAPA